MSKHQPYPRPPFPWEFKTVIKIITEDIPSASTWAAREFYFKQFLEWWKRAYQTDQWYGRMSRFCPSWMYKPEDWTPESVIQKLKSEPISSDDYYMVLEWFIKWDGDIRLSDRGRRNAIKGWAKRRLRGLT